MVLLVNINSIVLIVISVLRLVSAFTPNILSPLSNILLIDEYKLLAISSESFVVNLPQVCDANESFSFLNAICPTTLLNADDSPFFITTYRLYPQLAVNYA